MQHNLIDHEIREHNIDSFMIKEILSINNYTNYDFIQFISETKLIDVIINKIDEIDIDYNLEDYFYFFNIVTNPRLSIRSFFEEYCELNYISCVLFYDLNDNICVNLAIYNVNIKYNIEKLEKIIEKFNVNIQVEIYKNSYDDLIFAGNNFLTIIIRIPLRFKIENSGTKSASKINI